MAGKGASYTGRSAGAGGGKSILGYVVVAIVVASCGVGAFAYFSGGLDGLLGASDAKATPKLPESKIEVPAVVRPMRAYTKIELADLLNPRTRQFRTQILPKDQAKEKRVCLTAGDIVGRVLNRDMSPGMVFSENVFYPKGTAPGISGATPPGLFSFSLVAAQVSGPVYSLNRGDRFDLTALSTIDPKKAPALSLLPNTRVTIDMRSRLTGELLPEVERLVTNGLVLTPAVLPDPEGRRRLSRNDETLVIAVTPEEVTKIQAAQIAKKQLNVTIRSGRAPEGSGDGKDVKDARDLSGEGVRQPELRYEPNDAVVAIDYLRGPIAKTVVLPVEGKDLFTKRMESVPPPPPTPEKAAETAGGRGPTQTSPTSEDGLPPSERNRPDPEELLSGR